MTERPEKAFDHPRAHQQLLKMLHKGFLTPEEFAEAEMLLRQLLKPEGRKAGS